MSKHTPGPWQVDPQNRRDAWIRAESGKTVAYVHNAAENPGSEIDANARIISAAPDLLDALKRLLDECPMFCSDTESCECGEDGNGYMDGKPCEHIQARRAIFKATGK